VSGGLSYSCDACKGLGITWNAWLRNWLDCPFCLGFGRELLVMGCESGADYRERNRVQCDYAVRVLEEVLQAERIGN